LNKFALFGLLVLATALEASGDAVVRLGLGQQALIPRLLLFAAGAAILFAYGYALNSAPLDFGRVIGLYIASFFVVWQIVNVIAFRAAPTAPILLGGVLIVLGGCVVTFWRA
jgi:small multidrug resistance family-3 protein